MSAECKELSWKVLKKLLTGGQCLGKDTVSVKCIHLCATDLKLSKVGCLYLWRCLSRYSSRSPPARYSITNRTCAHSIEIISKLIINLL